MIIIFLGAPGAGKGTQAEVLQERLSMLHISSGNMLRDHTRRGTELGKIASGYMSRNELVPDDLIIEMIIDRLAAPDAERGVLLDGFPRTLPQAEALEAALNLRGKMVNAALYINVDDGVLIDRLSGRLTCRNCGHVYHQIFAPPKVEGICDFCGSELYQREDDTRESAIKRLSVYFNQTLPMIEYYRERSMLCEVNGDQPIDKVTEDLMVCLR
ncbi:MAG TPA: adenylate kinase [Chloroflexia bacterium]|jgi:adenylate kinase